MSDWISDIARQARADDEKREKYQSMFMQQSPGVWENIRHQIIEDVATINRDLELVVRRLGGQQLELEEQDGEITIKKHTNPAICLAVQFQRKFISIERVIVLEGQTRQKKTERENIHIELDERFNAYLRNEDGKTLNIIEVSKHILAPLLSS